MLLYRVEADTLTEVLEEYYRPICVDTYAKNSTDRSNYKLRNLKYNIIEKGILLLTIIRERKAKLLLSYSA